MAQRRAVVVRPVCVAVAMKVSSPRDPAEKEAEATARQIMRMAAPENARVFAGTAGGGVLRQGTKEEKKKRLQARFESPQIARFPGAGIFARQKKKEEEQIRRKAEGTPDVGANVAAEIRNSTAAGAPLPLSVRRFMEPRFRADFRAVRMHTGEKAAWLNTQLSAQAFTVGDQIFFGRDRFRPDTQDGRELIAHELTHTIQQGAAIQRRAAVTVSQQSPVMVQRLGIGDALNYFARQANLIPGFRMFTIVLGVNPINMSRVERNAANILRAVVEFIPGGGLITRALDNHGVFDRVGAWVEQQIRSLGMVGSSIRQAVNSFLNSLRWRDIFNLGGLWDRAKRIFTEPIGRIISFARGLITGIIRFIKEAILRPLARLAEGTRGYDLLKAVLGQDPITGKPVPRTAETLIGGFMRLIGQEEVWNNLRRANAVARAWAWFQGTLAELLGFVRQIPALFIQALQALELVDIVLLPRAFARVGTVFGTFIGRFISWAGQQVLGLLQIIFEVLAPGAMPYIRRAAGAFRSIIQNPIGFVGNLVRAGIQGFRQFATNFLTHLRGALIGWLTGTMGGAGVYIPQAFTLREIIKFVLSVLGLTWQNIRQKLVRVVGETTVSAMERGFEIIRTLVTQGPAAAWERIREGISNLREMVMEQIMTFVRNRIVQAAITRLVTSLNPAGAFIQAIIAIYNTIMFFIERLRQIAQVAMSFIDSIAAIASGAIAAAASRVERTMAGLLTLVISFLARLVGLGRVSDAVTNIINRIRAPIDRALDRVVAWIVAQARRLGRFVAQAGVPQDPATRLRLASQAAVAAARRLTGTVSAGLLNPLLAAIRVRYGLQSIVPFQRAGRWWVRVVINPTGEQDLNLPVAGAAGAAAVDTVNIPPIIGKLDQATAMFRLFQSRGTSPVAGQMLTTLASAKGEAQAIDRGQQQRRPAAQLNPLKQALANRLRAIQNLDPGYALFSIGGLAITITQARRQMNQVSPTPWEVIDPALRDEYVTQLNNQQDGINAMTADQWWQNRQRYRTGGRSPAEARLRAAYRRRTGSGRAAGTAAPHHADQVAGGFEDPTGLPVHAGVNSHIGSQWPERVGIIETAVRALSAVAQFVTQMLVRLRPR